MSSDATERGFTPRDPDLWLGQITSGGATPEVKVTFNKVRCLSETDWRGASDALGTVSQFLNRNAFMFVEERYQAYVSAQSSHADRFDKSPVTFDAHGIAFDLSTKLATWLLGFRLYLDHQETALKRNHGRDSLRVVRFKEQTARLFDNEPAYRLAYGLRNYTHVAMPGSLAGDKRSVDGTRDWRTFLDLRLNRDRLLHDFDGWHRFVEADLRRGPADLVVRPIMDVGQSCLREIIAAEMRADLPAALTAVESLRRLVEEAHVAYGEGDTILAKGYGGDGPGTIETMYVPTHRFAAVEQATAGRYTMSSLDNEIIIAAEPVI